jgi:M6 family metalloprotease-like protein
MKHLLVCIFCLTVLVGYSQKRYVPASPYPLTIKQPDGTSIEIYGKGDEFRHYSATEDGYSIIKNSSNVYEYAERGNDGQLHPSGIAAKSINARGANEIRFVSSLKKDIKPDKIIQEERLKTDEIKKVFPSSGMRKTLVLLIKYPDLNSTNTTADFNSLMNDANYGGTGSMHDYYMVCSDNKLNLSFDVYGWYTAAHNYTYYGDDNGDTRARVLVREAIDAAQAAGVNFSLYDNDKNGVVDNLLVVHSGPGAEEGSQTQYIWSHSWVLDTYSRTYDGVRINDYTIMPERRSYGMVGIGVFCHEFGHALGLPDLYDTDDTDGTSEGIGNWCLMSSGCWLNQEKTPAMMSAYCREQLGWNSPVVINWPISSSDLGNYTVQPSATSTECYKILTQNSNEYFLLENKYKTGFNSYMPGSGMAIFHINTNKSDNTDENNKLVDLEEADGKTDLDKSTNRGDAGDVFPGSSSNQRFNDSTNPNAKTYDLKSTGIDIQNISLSGSTMSFTLGSTSTQQPNLAYVSAQNSLTITGTVVDVSLQVTNNGNENAGAFKVGYYLSADNTITTSDYLIGTDDITSLAKDASASVGLNIDVSTIPSLPNGNYYVGYIIDYLGSVAESNETDNIYAFTSPTVHLSIAPNLTYVANNNSLQITGKNVNMALTVTNSGNSSAGAFSVGYYLSTDNSVTTSDYLIGTDPVGSLAIGASVNLGINVDVSTLPSIPDGVYYVGYIIDYIGNVSESNETDNKYIFQSPLLQYNVAPNLTFVSNKNSLQVTGTTVNLSMAVKNDGNMAAGSFVIGYYLSTNNTITQSGFLIGSAQVNSLSAGASLNENFSTDISMISGLPDGNYYVGYFIDYSGNISESNEADNTYAFATPQVQFYTSRNLTFDGSANGLRIHNDSVFIAMKAKNDGIAPSGLCYVGYYLSTNNSITTSDYLIGRDTVEPLNSNETSPESISVRIPDVLPNLPSGDYYVGFLVDYLNQVGETNETDNSYVFTNQLFSYCVAQYSYLNKTICQGDSFKLGATYYKTTGIYSKTFKDIHGCDSIVTLNLNVNPSYFSDISETVCYGDSVKMGNVVYKTTGTYTNNFETKAGCDSTIVLHLTVRPLDETHLFSSICNKDSVLFSGRFYKETGIYRATLTNRFGCDSIVTMNLTVNSSVVTSKSQSICQGDSLIFGSKVLKTQGLYTELFPSATGCDSTINLALTVNPANHTYISDTICHGGEVSISNLFYRESGIYTESFTNKYGCDSTVTLNLFVKPAIDTSIFVKICQGESYSVGNKTFNTAGAYQVKLASHSGCDSLVNLNLQILHPTDTTINASVCSGDYFALAGSRYNQAGTYTKTINNYQGCDSIITLNLTILKKDETNVEASVCLGDSIAFGTNFYKISGTYTHTFVNRLGCDSIVHLNLIVRQPYNLMTTQTICDGDSVKVGNSVYKTYGIFKDTLASQFGCDSIITTQIIVKPSYHIVLNQSICQGENFVLGSVSYNTTGTYFQTYTNKYGCDSTFILNLQVNKPDHVVLTQSVCEGEFFVMGGAAYNATGTYFKTLANRFGCDSVVTLNLTVRKPSKTELNIELCNGKTYTFGGKIYSGSGTYQAWYVNQFGCDSIVTLNLTINSPVQVVLRKTICQGDSVAIGNQSYSHAGIYSKTLQNINGCDSTVTLYLNVNPKNETGFSETICSGGSFFFAGSYKTSPGIYQETVPNQYGCDSVVTLRLNVLPKSDTLLITEIPEGDSLVIGQQVYKTAGTYIATLKNYAGCDSTITLKLKIKNSPPDAVFDLKNNNGNLMFSIYPNPANQYVNIKLIGIENKYTIKVISAEGKIMLSKEGYSSGDLTERIGLGNLSNGMYSVIIESGGRRSTKKLVIKN